MGHIVKNKQTSKQNTYTHYKMDTTERYMKQKQGHKQQKKKSREKKQ